MKTAIYARISTNDEKQNLQNQIDACLDFALGKRPASLGPAGAWPIAGTYIDRDSGAKESRPGLQKLLRDADRRLFECVIVFSLSRLTRGGPAKAFAYIEHLDQSEVKFHSVTEPLFTTSGPAGALFIALAAHIAQEERRNIGERVRAGMQRARKDGQKFGRPRAKFDPKILLKALHAGGSMRDIANGLGVSRSTALRIVRRHRETIKQRASE